MKGVTGHLLPTHADARGMLHAFEEGGALRFQPARVFFISRCPPDAVRACHAVSAHQALVVLGGQVTLDLDNGEEQMSLVLGGPEQLLTLEPGVWLRARDFSPDAVLMVASSQRYADVRYFDTPQPGLMFEHGATSG
ncbi:MAG: hypothetical protein RL434_1595 [Pseudomonadota bacterium]|jgi:hypothetical protein